MSKERAYNFSAGPSMLPLTVIEDVAANLANYEGCGESVMEMSHRSKEFKAILSDAEQNLRDIMNIPENYKVLFLQGGGTLQFAMVPLNLMRNTGKADYVVTGAWAKKAAKEAQRFLKPTPLSVRLSFGATGMRPRQSVTALTALFILTETVSRG